MPHILLQLIIGCCFSVAFFTVMDVFPYKSALHNLVAGFISLTKKVHMHCSLLCFVVCVDFSVLCMTPVFCLDLSL